MMPDRSVAYAMVMAMAAAGALAACRPSTKRAAGETTAGDPDRGRAAIRRYGCTSCHLIPGAGGPQAQVGPPLTQLAVRMYLAGALPNTPENLVRWIRQPQEIRPPNVMPDLGVSEAEARDIAAYLYTLE
jgi:cytochrome c